MKAFKLECRLADLFKTLECVRLEANELEDLPGNVPIKKRVRLEPLYKIEEEMVRQNGTTYELEVEFNEETLEALKGRVKLRFVL